MSSRAIDLDRGAMDDKTIEFASRAETADFAFVYYSGHGIQVEGVNYLVPIDAQFEDRRDLRRLVRLDQLTEDTGAAKKAILVVDACRNDPSQATSLTRAIGLNATRAPIATGARSGAAVPEAGQQDAGGVRDPARHSRLRWEAGQSGTVPMSKQYCDTSRSPVLR